MTLIKTGKTIIRQLFVAKAKETLGITRGTYSGKVMIPQAELTMDYQMLLTQGKEEYKETMETLKKRLEEMNPENYLKKQAEITNANRDILSGVPLGIMVI